MMYNAWTEPGFCFPNAEVYPHQWLWDSCFHAVVWARIDADRGVREIENSLAKMGPSGFVPHMTYWSDPFRRWPNSAVLRLANFGRPPGLARRPSVGGVCPAARPIARSRRMNLNGTGVVRTGPTSTICCIERRWRRTRPAGSIDPCLRRWRGPWSAGPPTRVCPSIGIRISARGLALVPKRGPAWRSASRRSVAGHTAGNILSRWVKHTNRQPSSGAAAIT